MKKAILIFIALLHFCNLIQSTPTEFLTQEEAKHAGVKYEPPPIITQFLNSKFSKRDDLQINDFLAHHRIVKEFCLSIKKKCTWSEYYLVLDEIRQPYMDKFDPGMEVGRKIVDIQKKGKSGLKYQNGCEYVDKPSAKEFYKYVVANKPIIITGVVNTWPALTKWTDEYLIRHIGKQPLPVGVSPYGDIVGPEPASLWGINDPEEPVIITRTARWNTDFVSFMKQLTYSFKIHQQETTTRNSRMNTHHDDEEKEKEKEDFKGNLNATFYLEYFPLALWGKKLIRDMNDITFSHFLVGRSRLMWMGGGNRSTVSKLHFDRNENLMAMIRGVKTFQFYDPGQSRELYADYPLRSGNLEFTFVNGTTVFKRNLKSLQEKRVGLHTYTPVDIARPNYDIHPKFKDLPTFNCTINPGEMLFIPSHWWHEVTSFDDDVGKSIGVNFFFEQFYHRPGFVTTSPYMQKNRYYSHITDLKTVSPCDHRRVCFLKKKSKHHKQSSSSSSSHAHRSKKTTRKQRNKSLRKNNNKSKNKHKKNRRNINNKDEL